MRQFQSSVNFINNNIRILNKFIFIQIELICRVNYVIYPLQPHLIITTLFEIL